jgi:hypothetical protein
MPIMKKTWPLAIFLVFVQLISMPLFSQKEKPKYYKNCINFNITRLALLEARFGYERQLSERHVIRTSLGIKFPVSNTFQNVSLGLGSVPASFIVQSGYYLGLGYNYLINPSKYLYVSAEVYYNYLYYNDKYYQNKTGQSKEDYVNLQSQQLDKSGIKFLIGRKASTSPYKNTRLQFDFYAGVGIQYRQEETTIYQKKYGSYNIDPPDDFYVYNPPLIEISDNWYPTLNAGILFSYSFSKK